MRRVGIYLDNSIAVRPECALCARAEHQKLCYHAVRDLSSVETQRYSRRRFALYRECTQPFEHSGHILGNE